MGSGIIRAVEKRLESLTGSLTFYQGAAGEVPYPAIGRLAKSPRVSPVISIWHSSVADTTRIAEPGPCFPHYVPGTRCKTLGNAHSGYSKR